MMRCLYQKRNSVRQETVNQSRHAAVFHGRTRLVLQRLWLLIVVFEVIVLISNIQAIMTAVNTACPDTTGASCISLQLKTAQLPALSQYGLKLSDYALYALSCDLILTVLLLSIGIVIFWHKSHERMGLFVSLLLITFACFGIDDVNLVIKPPFPFVILAFVIFICQWPALGILFYTFPDGRFVPRWSWLLSFLFVIQLVFYLLPSPYQIGNWPPLLQNTEMLIVLGSAASTQIYRYCFVALPQQRLQIKWFAFSFAITLTFSITWNLLPLLIPALNRPNSWYQLSGPATLALFYLPIPLGMGIALLRYRLWDIDIVINRTLVYGLLTVSVIVLYILVVLGFGSLIQARGNLLLSLLATGLIAVLFQPSRERLQQGVNRLMYGERDDPYRVLSRLGKRLEATLTPEAILPTIVETVAQALKLPFAAITQGEGVEAKPVAVYGKPNEQGNYTMSH